MQTYRRVGLQHVFIVISYLDFSQILLEILKKCILHYYKILNRDKYHHILIHHPVSSGALVQHPTKSFESPSRKQKKACLQEMGWVDILNCKLNCTNSGFALYVYVWLDMFCKTLLHLFPIFLPKYIQMRGG